MYCALKFYVNVSSLILQIPNAVAFTLVPNVRMHNVIARGVVDACISNADSVSRSADLSIGGSEEDAGRGRGDGAFLV